MDQISTKTAPSVFLSKFKKPSHYSIISSRWTTRDGSRAAATSKMERFVIIVNGFQPLTIITKPSILVVAAALDPPLTTTNCLSVFDHYVGRSATLLKKRLWHRCFPVNIEKFLRTPFLQNTSRRLLLLYLTRFSNFSYFKPTHKLNKFKFRISIRGAYNWNEFLSQTRKEIESTFSFQIVT